MNTNKAFTLIELLAVIAVLAIILLIAVPNAITIMNDSGKAMFNNGAKKLIDVAKIYALENNVVMPEPGSYVSISITDLDFENSESYDTTGGVLIINDVDTEKYDYYVYLSNAKYVLNGANKSHINDAAKNLGVAIPDLPVTIPTAANILVNTTLGFTGNVENVTSPGGGYVTYTLN